MQYGTLRGESVQKCLMQLRSQYGSDVFVIDTREVTESGFLGTGLFKKKIYEVDYMIKEQNAPYHNPPAARKKSTTQKKTAEQAALSFLAGGSASTGDDSESRSELGRGRSSEYPSSRKRGLPAPSRATYPSGPAVKSAEPARSAGSGGSVQGKDSGAPAASASDQKDVVPELDQLIASLKALKEETGREVKDPARTEEEKTSDERMERLLKKMDEMARAEAGAESKSQEKGTLAHPNRGSGIQPPRSGSTSGSPPERSSSIRVAEPPSAEEIDALWSEEYEPSVQEEVSELPSMPAEAELSDEDLLAAADKYEERPFSHQARKLEIHTGRGWPSRSLDSRSQGMGAQAGKAGPAPAELTASYEDPTARKFMQIRKRLMDSNLSSELADRIIQSVDDSLSRNDLQHTGRIEEATLEKLSSIIRMVPDIAPPRGECRAVMLVGPTGSGKSSSIAKLAARYMLKEQREVSIYNLDLYRLGATEMLKTYAQIIHAPFFNPFTPEEFGRLLDDDTAEIMLIDTPGIGGRSDRLQQLKAFKEACPVNLDVHLTVAAGTDSRMIDRIFEAFDSFGFDKILLTKLDETDFFGAVIEHADKFNRPFSFLMDDPEVRGNIMDARPADLARMLLD